MNFGQHLILISLEKGSSVHVLQDYYRIGGYSHTFLIVTRKGESNEKESSERSAVKGSNWSRGDDNLN
jgi:hypothetical protein